MRKNAAQRSLAKFQLNRYDINPCGFFKLASCPSSFWGKLGQRSSLGKTEYFSDPAAFFDLVFNPTICTKSVRVVNDKMVAVSYDVHEDFVEVMSNTNTVIAAYTTAQARLKLYSYIEKLQERVLYFDTDSILYIDRPTDAYHPEVGNFLGNTSPSRHVVVWKDMHLSRGND